MVAQGHAEQNSRDTGHQELNSNQGSDQPETGPRECHIEQYPDQEREDAADGEEAPSASGAVSSGPEGTADSGKDQASGEDGGDEDGAGCGFFDQKEAAEDIEAADEAREPLVGERKASVSEALHDLGDSADDEQDAEENHAG